MSFPVYVQSTYVAKSADNFDEMMEGHDEMMKWAAETMPEVYQCNHGVVDKASLTTNTHTLIKDWSAMNAVKAKWADFPGMAKITQCKDKLDLTRYHIVVATEEQKQQVHEEHAKHRAGVTWEIKPDFAAEIKDTQFGMKPAN